jgi:8-oxo-dGTP pyrophosphatase MutT (NUDIX family)
MLPPRGDRRCLHSAEDTNQPDMLDTLDDMADDSNGAPRTRVLDERTIYDNEWVRVVQMKIEPPDGRQFWHHVVRLQTVALALVVDEQDRVLMVWRHRFVPDAFGWELPGGIVGKDEDPETTAAREMEEETGWRPKVPMRRIQGFQPMPGMVDTPHVIFLADGAEHVSEPIDLEEAGVVEWIPLRDVQGLIRDGKVAGSGSLVGLLHVLALGRQSPDTA